MTRKVFFSFHYNRDAWRVSQVRNSWLLRPSEHQTSNFLDAADWESIQREGEVAIQRWIDNQLKGTSVTIILIGAETANRKYVDYEIKKSYNLQKGLLGIYIHQIKNSKGQTDTKGKNPFAKWQITLPNGTKKALSEIYPTYDWVDDNGRINMPAWIEKAAKAAGK
jgi:hypothetical protein